MDTVLDFGSQTVATDATGNPAGSRATHASPSSLVDGPLRKSIEPGMNPSRPSHGAGVVGAGSSHSLLGPSHEPAFPHDLYGGAPALSGSSFDDEMGLPGGSLTGRYKPTYTPFHNTPLSPSPAAERRPSMGGFAPFAGTGSMLQDDPADINSHPPVGSNDRRFSCLLGLSDSLTEELEREERRKARGIWRYKADLWGKLLMPNRKKALNDPTFYDSEDSDYVPSPPISDETALSRMLAIDRSVKGLKSTESPQLKREMMQIGYSSRRWAKVLIKAHKTIRKPAPSTPARDLSTSRPRKPTARPDSIYYHPLTQVPRPSIKKQDDMSMPQPPKRDSKPLDTHYVVDEDGTLRCIGCNKGGYRSTLGVRSHLSHCPAKQAQRQQRGNIKMEDFLATQPDVVDRDTRLPAQPRRRPATQQHAEDFSLGASSHRSSIPLGLPLAHTTFSHSSLLVSRVVSFRVAEDAPWEDARLQSYDDRSNCHQVALCDGRVLWAVLTTHNCRQATQQEERKPSAAPMQRRDAAFGSSSAAAPVPVRKPVMTGDGDMSSTEGDDTRSISSGTRRSSRHAVGSTPGDAGIEKALGRNQFWRQYEEQLPKSGGKRKASYTTSMDKALQSSDEEENESGPRRKMRTGPSKAASEAQQQLQNALMGGDYNMGSGFQASGYFPCRECTAVFRSKQHLGWHTRRNECRGSEVYETPTPPMPPSAPQEPQPAMPAPTTNEDMASSKEVERSAFAPQKRGAEAITEDMGEEEEEAANRKKPRRG